MAQVSLLDHFSALADPRQAWKVSDPLDEILLLVLCRGRRLRRDRAVGAAQAGISEAFQTIRPRDPQSRHAERRVQRVAGRSLFGVFRQQAPDIVAISWPRPRAAPAPKAGGLCTWSRPGRPSNASSLARRWSMAPWSSTKPLTATMAGSRRGRPGSATTSVGCRASAMRPKSRGFRAWPCSPWSKRRWKKTARPRAQGVMISVRHRYRRNRFWRPRGRIGASKTACTGPCLH